MFQITGGCVEILVARLVFSLLREGESERKWEGEHRLFHICVHAKDLVGRRHFFRVTVPSLGLLRV